MSFDIRLQLQREAPLRKLMKLTRVEVIDSPTFGQKYASNVWQIQYTANSPIALQKITLAASSARRVQMRVSSTFPLNLRSFSRPQFDHALDLSTVFPILLFVYTPLFRSQTLPKPYSKAATMIMISSTMTTTLPDFTISNSRNRTVPVLIVSKSSCGKCWRQKPIRALVAAPVIDILK